MVKQLGKEPYSQVEVTWTDIVSLSQWMSADDACQHVKPMPMRTVGYLLKQDKQNVWLGMTLSQEGSTNITMVIPKAVVQDIRMLKPVK